jgi:hypothetical protein
MDHGFPVKAAIVILETPRASVFQTQKSVT